MNSIHAEVLTLELATIGEQNCVAFIEGCSYFRSSVLNSEGVSGFDTGKWDAQTMHLLFFFFFAISARNVAITKK